MNEPAKPEEKGDSDWLLLLRGLFFGGDGAEEPSDDEDKGDDQ